MAIIARDQISLSSIRDLYSCTRYYLLQASTLSPPSKPTSNPPGGNWVTSEPTYTSDSTNSLYYVDLNVFSDGDYDYSAVSLSSSYEAAKVAYNKAQNAQDSIDNLEIGGRNLLPSSAFSADGMTTRDTGRVSGYGTTIIPVGSFPELAPNTTYTFSWIAIYEEAHSDGTYILQRVFGLRIYSATVGTVAASINNAAYDTMPVGDIVSHSVTFTTPAEVPDDLVLQYHTRRWRNEGSTKNYFDTFRFTSIQLERGPIRTDYAPCPEDTAVGIDNAQAAAAAAQANVGSAESRIEDLSGEFYLVRDNVNMWFTFDKDRGLVISRPPYEDDDGVEHIQSIYSTITDEEGFHIRREDLPRYLFSAYRDRCRIENLEIGDLVMKKTAKGGQVWVSGGAIGG